MYNISHSDLKSWDQCEYNWFYARYLNLTPRVLPDPLQLGTFGHTLAEEGFKVLLAGGTYEEAVEAAGKCLIDIMTTKPEFSKVLRHVSAFFAYFLEQGYRVVDLEKKSYWKMNDDFSFGFTPDITLEHTQGNMKGQLSILDYKFIGQYWTPREVYGFQQVPKYIVYKNKLEGTNIRSGGIAMFNTRANAKTTNDQLFIIKWIKPTKHRLELIEHENERQMQKIFAMKQFGDTYGEEALKSALNHTSIEKNCKFCFFADDLCPMDADGRDTTRVRERNFKLNTTYGYNGETDSAK